MEKRLRDTEARAHKLETEKLYTEEKYRKKEEKLQEAMRAMVEME